MNGTHYAFFFQWHLTERCNLRCRHCYQMAPAGEMTAGEICKAIDELADTVEYWVANYGVEMSPGIHFTGGEPFIRDDLFFLLGYAREKGFFTSILSNGTLITDDIARKVREAGARDVQVSLDGMEAVHDSLRGQGTFARAIAGINSLVAQHIPVSINMTVSALNYQELDRLLPLAGELGVSAVTFSRLVPCGRGEEMGKYLLSTEQLSGLYRKLPESADSGAPLICRDPLAGVAGIASDADIPRVDFPVGGCAAGIFGVTIAADGAIMPCRRMNLSIGNIKVDSFRRLWVESPVLASLRRRERYHGNCRSCLYWAVCRGCRAIARASASPHDGEGYLGPDPQCAAYKPGGDFQRR